ncbi:MAG: carboxypeptidase-like regulatory domain-containing protein [Bacteriovoracia bacterium]
MRFLFLIFISVLAFAESNFKIRGVVVEKGTRKPLADVRVYLLPQKIVAQTDAEGRFEIDNVPEGKFQWVINVTGYNRYEESDEIQKDQENLERKFFLERDSYLVFETTVYDKQRKRDAGTKILKQEEVAKMPGAAGDPVRAVQNLPGVNRVSGFDARVVIQGSGPQETKYTLEGHEIPIVFHFGGLNSIIQNDAIERVDYLAAGYGPEFGRATGGLIGLWTRKPKKDRIHGLGFVDIFNSGLLLEGPLSEKSSFLVGVRQSYVGLLLNAVFKDNSDFDLTVAPSFRDMTAIYESEVSPTTDFRVTAIGSQDSLEFLLKKPVESDPSIRGTFENRTNFFRVIPQITQKYSETTTGRYSLGLGRDWLKIEFSDNYFALSTYQTTARGELEHKFTPEWNHFIGIDSAVTWAQANLKVPKTYGSGGVSTPFSSGRTVQKTIYQRSEKLGFYTRNELHWQNSPWTFLPNFRVDYFSLTNEILPAPRPALKYAIDQSLILRSSGGLYYQPPLEQEQDSDYGNPDIKSPRAWHATIGAEKDFRNGSSEGLTISSDAFYKKLERIVVASGKYRTDRTNLTPENYNNDGQGWVIGVQTLVRLDLRPWSASLNYTLSKSRRKSGPNATEYPATYDQTHLLGVLGGVDLPNNWRLSSRFRYSTGNPATPIVGGIFDSDNDVYLPIRGALYSTRLDPFYQLDFRVDKKFVFDNWILSAYLDIQNVTNRKNSESLVYAYDYTQSEKVSGLPFLPIFGLKGEF